MNLFRYKQFSKIFSPLICIPQKKILKFHRSKWKKIQKLILQKQQQKTLQLKFKYYSKNFCNINRWEKLFLVFGNQIILKKMLKILFSNTLSNIFFKKIYKNNKSNKFSSYFQSLLCKAEYKIEILLFRLNFFPSTFWVKHYIKQNKIFLNNTKLKYLISLIKGDVIHILNIKKHTFKNKLKTAIFLHTFVEIDFYINQIVIIKNLYALNEKDFFLLSRDFYNILYLQAGSFN